MRSDLHPVTQPVVAGCDVVLYDATGGDLRVVALEAATGRTAWQINASASSVTPGVSPTLALAGGVVTLYKAVGTRPSAELVGLDARSGSVVWHSPPAEFTGWPTPCPDDATVICATATNATQTGVLRFTATTGHRLQSAIVATNPNGRDVGPGLYDPGARSPDVLVAVRGGSVAWQRPLSSVFRGSGLSTDNGWNFDVVPSDGLFVGSVGGPPLSQTANSAVIDMSRGTTSGFRDRDGVVVWTTPGTQYVCTALPCNGPTSGSYSGAYRPPAFGVRLRGTGTIHVTIQPEHATFTPGAKVVLEGFDLATGRTTWSFDAGQDLALIQNTTPPQIGVETVVLPDSNGKLTTLNLATGAHGSLEAAAVLWCQTPITYKTKLPYRDSSGHTSNVYQGENATFPCNTHSHPIPAPARVPTFVGDTINGLVLWSEANSVVAAPSAT